MIPGTSLPLSWGSVIRRMGSNPSLTRRFFSTMKIMCLRLWKTCLPFNPHKAEKKWSHTTESVLWKSRTCLGVFPGNTSLHFTWKSPLVTCSPGLHTHCHLCNLLCTGIFLRCVRMAFGTYFYPSTFSFQVGLLKLAFYLPLHPSWRFEARVICNELSKETFLGRNEYFPIQTFENSLQYLLLDVPRVWEY